MKEVNLILSVDVTLEVPDDIKESMIEDNIVCAIGVMNMDGEELYIVDDYITDVYFK